MFRIADRVKETTVTTGIGSVVLTGAYTGFQSFDDGIGDGNITYYAIENNARWEVGQGTYSQGSNSLSRDIVFASSNNGNKIVLEGNSTVFGTLPAAKAFILDPNNDVNASGFIGDSGVFNTINVNDLLVSGSATFDSDVFFNNIFVTGEIVDSGFLTLIRPNSAGNFFHAYKDDPFKRTVSLYVDGNSAPQWRLGLKANPSDQDEAPQYGYVFGRDGLAGLLADASNYLSLTNSNGLLVTNQDNLVFSTNATTNTLLEGVNSASPTFVVTAPILASEDIQRWNNSSDITLSVVDSGGKLGILTSSPLYDLDVSGSGRMESIHLTSGIYFQDNTFQSTAAFGDAFAVSGWADATMTTRDNAVSGWADSTMTARDNAISGYFQTYTDNQDAAISGIAVYASGHNLQSVTDNGNTTTNDIYTSGLLSASGNVFGASGCFQAIDFELGVGAGYKEGRVFYDDENHALAVYNDESEITLQVGQEEYIRVRNNSGSDIGNGKPVFITGSQGTHTTVELGIASGELQSEVIGLATHDIGNNEFGYITTFGLVRGLDTSSFSEGDEIFLDAVNSGELTNVSPLAPNYKTSIGHVVRSHPSQGSILVTPRDHKLGGGDIKTFGQIQDSGIPFLALTTENSSQIRAGILASDPSFYYDSGNYRLHIGAGGIRFNDGTTQTTAASGTGGGGGSVSGTPSGVAFFGDDGLLTDKGSFFYSSGDGTLTIKRDGAEIDIRGTDSQLALRLGDRSTSSNNAGRVIWYVNGTNYGFIEATNSHLNYQVNASTRQQKFNSAAGNTLFIVDGGNEDYSTLVTTQTTTDIAQVIQGTTSQTADLTQWRDSSQNVLAHVDSGGTIATSGGVFATDKLAVGSGDHGSYLVNINTTAYDHNFIINDSNGRIGINTETLSSDLNIGGARQLKFTGGNAFIDCDGGSFLYLRAGGTTFLQSDGTGARFFGYNAGAQINMQTQVTGRRTLVIERLAGQTADILQIRDESDGDIFKVDANGNVTASGDVTIDGNVYASGATVSGIYLYNHTPADTTNTLYNVAGALYFNGSEVGGGSSSNRTYNNITADFSMSDTSDVVFMDTTSGPINVYVPTAAGQGGKEIMVKLKAGSNSGVLIGSGAQTIDGESQIAVYNTYESITLISDNTNWFIS
jgi:hypothetical protein